MQKKIGLFGGCFNPPHIGHFHLIESAIDQYCLDEIIFIPCMNSPYNDKVINIDSNHRINMLMEGLATFSHSWKIEMFEINNKDIVSYTIDTIKFIKDTYGNENDYFLICGHDTASRFDTWKNSSKLTQEIDICIAGKNFECIELNIR